MKIEGVPAGYELVRIGIPKDGDLFMHGRVGHIDEYDESVFYNTVYPIVRKIERPKTYRPFANAAEFKPHRDRWVRFYEGCLTKKIGAYSEPEVEIIGDGNWGYDAAFASYVFDDGTPFGVDVSE